MSATSPRGRAAPAATRGALPLLAGAQALLFINNATILAVNGVVGQQLAAAGGYDAGSATLPVTAWVLGGAVMAYPAAQIMRRHGRGAGFSVGAVAGIAGALLAILAIEHADFVGFCLAAALSGIYNAFGLQYRFAAADAVPLAAKARAIGQVMTAGLVGGFAGPEVSRHTAHLFTTPFTGVFAALACCALIALLLLRRLDVPVAPTRPAGSRAALHALLCRPIFLLAVGAAALAHGLMSLLMTATTLTMTSYCGHPYGAAAQVLGAHMVAMFAPSFVTGMLVQRVGETRVMLTGCGIFALSAAIALDGLTLGHFWGSMILLGVGWNLLFVGASALLVRSCREDEAAYAQGLNEACVFASMVLASFLSGYLLRHADWQFMSALVLAGALGLALALAALARGARLQRV